MSSSETLAASSVPRSPYSNVRRGAHPTRDAPPSRSEFSRYLSLQLDKKIGADGDAVSTRSSSDSEGPLLLECHSVTLAASSVPRSPYSNVRRGTHPTRDAPPSRSEFSRYLSLQLDKKIGADGDVMSARSPSVSEGAELPHSVCMHMARSRFRPRTRGRPRASHRSRFSWMF